MAKLTIEKESDKINLSSDGDTVEIVTMISDIMFQSDDFARIIEIAFKNYLAHGGNEVISDESLELSKMEVNSRKFNN